jgi:hypothetical protein
VDAARTELWTDAAKTNVTADATMRSHEMVDHVRRGGITTNVAGGYFSQLKRSIDGAHHRVS